MAKANKKKAPKIPKFPDEFELTHLLGNSAQKLAVYQDFRCPLDIQKQVALAYMNEEESFLTTNQDLNYLKALVCNPNLDPSLAVTISEQARSSLIKKLSLNNPNHPQFLVKLLEQVSSNFIMPFFGFLKDNNIENLLRTHGVLTGTALASLIQSLSGSERGSLYQYKNNGLFIKDWDLFFKDREAVKEIVNYFYNNFQCTEKVESLNFIDTDLGVEISNLPKSLVGKYIKKGFFNKHEVEMVLTQNALTLKYDKNNAPVQFIFKVCGTPNQITDNFDFYHCQVAIELDHGKASWSGEVLWSILNQRLLYHGGLNPLSAFFRMKKFEYRGWKIDRLQIVKMLHDISKLNLNDAKVLKKQLEGFYFEESYPEIFKIPDKILTDEELWEILDRLSLKF